MLDSDAEVNLIELSVVKKYLNPLAITLKISRMFSEMDFCSNDKSQNG